MAKKKTTIDNPKISAKRKLKRYLTKEGIDEKEIESFVESFDEDVKSHQYFGIPSVIEFDIDGNILEYGVNPNVNLDKDKDYQIKLSWEVVVQEKVFEKFDNILGKVLTVLEAKKSELEYYDYLRAEVFFNIWFRFIYSKDILIKVKYGDDELTNPKYETVLQIINSLISNYFNFPELIFDAFQIKVNEEKIRQSPEDFIKSIIEDYLKVQETKNSLFSEDRISSEQIMELLTLDDKKQILKLGKLWKVDYLGLLLYRKADEIYWEEIRKKRGISFVRALERANNKFQIFEESFFNIDKERYEEGYKKYRYLLSKKKKNNPT